MLSAASKSIKRIAMDEHRICRITSWVFGLLTLSIVVVYGSKALFQGAEVVGGSFVLEELSIPFFPFFYAKPITWFSFFGFLYWAFGLETWRKRITRLAPLYRKIMFIVVALIAFGSLYEVFFNFAIWIALMSVEDMTGVLNPDLLANPFNVPRPINLVFATKICFLIFGLSVYSLYYLRTIGKEPESLIKLTKSTVKTIRN